MNYSKEYNDYWSRADRIGEFSSNPEITANLILSTCGLGRMLDIGSGEGALVTALLRRGVDATGLDVSEVVVERCNSRAPGRFVLGSVLELPFGDAEFDAVVSTDCMEHLAPTDVVQALQEIRRVVRKYVFLQIATTQDRDDHWHLTVEKRPWWEAHCFRAGFRKHPQYYKVNDYESLNADGWQIYVLLEKIQDHALIKYPLVALEEERGLHMDMLRETGERSDAHVIRYHWACGYIKPGDRVLDAACGLGYGGHVVRNLTDAASVTGVDGSKYAIDYAESMYGDGSERAQYILGMLPEALAMFPEGSFDAIISFETLEHVDAPEELLKEFSRLLTPSGRIIVSVPNDWSDESGEDPNPFHLQVYDLERLRREVCESFLLEATVAQSASQAKVLGQRNVWERKARELRTVSLDANEPVSAEWWLMVGMKSPLSTGVPFAERVYANVAESGHPSLRSAESYKNPWLVPGMINITHRMSDANALDDIARQVSLSAEFGSNDQAASLCVRAYNALESACPDATLLDNLHEGIAEILATSPADLIGLRWRISLQFVKAKIYLAQGRFFEAKEAFIRCANQDVRDFGIHLATKTTEAWFQAGRLAYASGSLQEAADLWTAGVDSGTDLLAVGIDDIVINKEFPNLFNHGDGVREYALAWDNIGRCANGIHLLRRGGNFDVTALEGSFQAEYEVVTHDLIESRAQLLLATREMVDLRHSLVERTKRLDECNRDLLSRTQDLVSTRVELVDRTRQLESQTSLLVERTDLLENAISKLAEREHELIEVRQLMSAQARGFEKQSRELSACNEDLAHVRNELVARTELLAANGSLLVERTNLLEEALDDLKRTRAELIERTGLLEETLGDLNITRAELVERTASLGELHAKLVECAEILAKRDRELIEQSSLLDTANLKSAALESELDLANSEMTRLSKGFLNRASVFLRKR